MKSRLGLILIALNMAEIPATSFGAAFTATSGARCDLPGDFGHGSALPAASITAQNAPTMIQKRHLAESAYFISTEGNDAWSGRLASPNADKSDGPFATLERARDAVRAVRSARPETASFAIYFRKGRYRFTQPVVFAAEDTGITIGAYEDEQPELAGSVTVNNWRPGTAGRFSAVSPVAIDREIFVAGERQTLSIKPGTAGGWQNAGVVDAPNSFSFSAGSVGPQALERDVRVELRDTPQSWNAFTRIAAIDAERHTATIAVPESGPVSDIGTFRLRGKAAWVGKSGQFGRDPSGRKIVLFPSRAAALLKSGAQIPVSSSLIIFRGAHDDAVTGLTFEETATAPSSSLENAAITFEDAFANTVSGNNFINVGQAIRLTRSSGNLIADNVVSNAGGVGIELQDGSDKNEIAGNTLKSVGRIDQASAAIYLHAASENRISRNTIADVPRHGIGIDNWDDATVNIGNVVEYNKLRNTNEDTFDTGAIEMLGRSGVDTKSIIRYNDIQDAGPTAAAPEKLKPTVASGIYLDDLTSGVLVCANRISGAPLAAIQVHGGSNVTVRDNFAILDRPGAAFMFMQSAPPKSGGTRFNFNWTNSPPEPANTPHRIEFRFDNDAVIGSEDRDLFLGKIEIGSYTIKPDDSRYAVDNGKLLPGEAALPWNGALVWNFQTPALIPGTPVPVSVYAWSNTAGGIGGHFILKIDGEVVGEGTAPALQGEMTNNVVTHNIVYATADGDSYYKDLHAGAPLITGNGYLDLTGGRNPENSPLSDANPIQLNRESLFHSAAGFQVSDETVLREAGIEHLPICAAQTIICKSATDKRAIR